MPTKKKSPGHKKPAYVPYTQPRKPHPLANPKPQPKVKPMAEEKKHEPAKPAASPKAGEPPEPPLTREKLNPDIAKEEKERSESATHSADPTKESPGLKPIKLDPKTGAPMSQEEEKDNGNNKQSKG